LGNYRTDVKTDSEESNVFLIQNAERSFLLV